MIAKDKLLKKYTKKINLEVRTKADHKKLFVSNYPPDNKNTSRKKTFF